MSSAPTPHGLHFVARSPVPGLAVAERRVEHPEATIICIHGGLDRGGSFARLARRTDRFDLVTYDRRGYQGSRDLGPLGLEYHVDDLIALAQLVVTYEAPLPWILRRNGTGEPLGGDPELEAERFFRRIVSDSAWKRLSEFERDSRRRDGPALVSDLSSLRSATAPFDIRTLRVPAVFVYGDVLAPDFYRTLGTELASINPLIQRRQAINAAHGAHLSIPDQLAALIAELWDDTCASA